MLAARQLLDLRPKMAYRNELDILGPYLQTTYEAGQDALTILLAIVLMFAMVGAYLFA